MKEILIISGKGGAGKTSLCAAFAVLAGNSVLVDCDVDASDLHLLLKPEVRETHAFVSGSSPAVDPSLCTRCGECVEVCRFDAFRVGEGGCAAIDGSACEGCGVCAALCPARAIRMEPRLCGEWYESSTARGTMFHAKLLPGGENSGKLVAEIRRAARSYAGETGAERILLDGPPGIGCPVISAMTGVDLAVVVTEPTVSGLHDLNRTLELARQFEIDCAVVLNKADLNREMAGRTRNFCGGLGVEVIGEIPFDALFNRALKEGKTMVDYPESVPGRRIAELWEIIQTKGNRTC